MVWLQNPMQKALPDVWGLWRGAVWILPFGVASNVFRKSKWVIRNGLCRHVRLRKGKAEERCDLADIEHTDFFKKNPFHEKEHQQELFYKLLKFNKIT